MDLGLGGRLLSDGCVVFQVVGGVILGLTLLSQVVINSHGGDQVTASAPQSHTQSHRPLNTRLFCPQLEGRTVGLIVLYVMGSVTMVIAILGAYGAHKENRVCLIVVSTGGDLGGRLEFHRTAAHLCVLLSWAVPGVYGYWESDHTPYWDPCCLRPLKGGHAHSPFN